METAIQKKINGFKSQEIRETLDTLQHNPQLAQFKFRANNKWIQGGHNRSTIHDFYGCGQEDESRKKPFVYHNGEPPVLLGDNEGANPVEFVLHALAGCMTTTMVLHAAARGIEIDSIESYFEGDLDVQGFLGLDESVRNGYQQIHVRFDIIGNLSEEQKDELISFTSNSPVFDVITNSVPIQVSRS